MRGIFVDGFQQKRPQRKFPCGLFLGLVFSSPLVHHTPFRTLPATARYGRSKRVLWNKSNRSPRIYPEPSTAGGFPQTRLRSLCRCRTRPALPCRRHSDSPARRHRPRLPHQGIPLAHSAVRSVLLLRYCSCTRTYP